MVFEGTDKWCPHERRALWRAFTNAVFSHLTWRTCWHSRTQLVLVTLSWWSALMSHTAYTILHCLLCWGPNTLLEWWLEDEGNHIKGPKKRGPDIIKSERLLANARRSCSRKTLLIFRGFGQGQWQGLSLPLSLIAWHGRDVTESTKQMDGGIERDGGMGRRRRWRRTNTLFSAWRKGYCEQDR